MQRREINASDAPAPAGLYTQAIEVTGATRMVYISGQVGIAADGTAQGDTALAPEVGAAVYFCCAEALQNTVKHCPGAPVEVTAELDTGPDRVCFSIADQGPGFDAEAVEGGGLQNMADRIGAVGGEVRVSSAAGTGTQVTGWVPVALATSEAGSGATSGATPVVPSGS